MVEIKILINEEKKVETDESIFTKVGVDFIVEDKTGTKAEKQISDDLRSRFYKKSGFISNKDKAITTEDIQKICELF